MYWCNAVKYSHSGFVGKMSKWLMLISSDLFHSVFPFILLLLRTFATHLILPGICKISNSHPLVSELICGALGNTRLCLAWWNVHRCRNLILITTSVAGVVFLIFIFIPLSVLSSPPLLWGFSLFLLYSVIEFVSLPRLKRNEISHNGTPTNMNLINWPDLILESRWSSLR